MYGRLYSKTVHANLDENVYSVSCQSVVDTFFYNAITAVEDKNRELIDKLWSEIST